MPKTTYTKEEYILKDQNGAYLKANTNNTEYITDYNKARKFKNKGQAEHAAETINKTYEMDHITDVWGQPKNVHVFKMTTSVVIEEVE